MKVTLLGTSGGIPIPGRAQSGVLVETQNKNVLFDCGMGIPLRLSEAGLSSKDIDIVCITHGHLDHIQDLPSLTKASWLDEGKAEYQILTPPNLKEKLINFWSSLDEYDRTDLDFKVLKPGEEFQDDLRIRSFKTDHTESSQGYRISEGANSVVYTGDTAACEDIREVSREVDLLIHELSLIEESELHTTPESLISEIKDIKTGELALTHFYPSVAKRADDFAKIIQEETGVSTRAGVDLQEYRYEV